MPMTKTIRLAATVAACALAAGAAAEDGAGLVARPLTIANASGAPIACAAAVAHWFSVDLGRADPGGGIKIALLADPATGAVFVLNEKGDRLPVERLWCGFAGRAWETRAAIGLGRERGTKAEATALTCTAQGERLACR
jgi:hypothetical protein